MLYAWYFQVMSGMYISVRHSVLDRKAARTQFSRKVYRKSVPGNANVEIEHEVSTTGCLCAEQNTNRVATVEAAAVLVQSVIVGNTLNRPACGMHCCPNSKECTHSTCPSVTVFRKSLTSAVVRQC